MLSVSPDSTGSRSADQHRTRGSSAALRYSQYDGHDGQELAGRCELHAVVHLLPVREQPSLPLIWRLKRGSFHGM